MDEPECPPVTVEGDWSPAQTKSMKNKLQLYFQSKKKSSGGDCRVEAEDGAPRAAVYFRSEDVRERVLARKNHEIILENRTVTLRLISAASPTSSDDTSGATDSKTQASDVEPADGASAENKEESASAQSVSVVLDNVSDNMSRDLLCMLVENVSGLDESGYSLEIIWETNRAVITFNKPADVERFLGRSSQKLQRHGLTARPLEAAESVRVESLPPTVVKEMLELYFEKNWTLPENIVMIPSEQAAIATFSDPKVVESICIKQDYVMRTIPVKMYPYHESLGSALYGKERPTWKMPEPFTESVHHVVWKFLLMKKLLKSINDQMSPFFCSVDLDNPEVKLSPLPSFLRQKGLTAKHVDNWMSTAQKAFREQMSQYTTIECPANAHAWKVAEKDVRSVIRENAIPVLDASRGILTLAGGADDIKQIKAPVENIVLKAMDQIKRQTDSVSEIMNMSPAMFYILQQEGFQKAAQDISPDMKLSFDEGTQKLTITGLPAEVFQTKAWILEKKSLTSSDDTSGESASTQRVSVVLDNVSDNMSRDLLCMLVENVSGLDESGYSLEIIWETDRAVITFNKPADVERFLGRSSQKLQRHGLTARPLEAAESVRVESLPPTVVKEMLELYFEKNWTLPENIVMIPSEQAAIATFSDPKVVESICIKQDYVMRTIPVKMYPYHESLGSTLYGKERPTWKMPEPFTESVHHVVWKFLLMKKLLKSINDQMSPFFCSVDLDNPEVKLSPLPSFLRQKGLTAKHVDNWMSTAQKAFREQMSQYTTIECPANAHAWKVAEKDVRSVIRENAIPVLDASRGILTLAGGADDIKQIKAPVENIVLKAMDQIKRQTDSVSEIMNMSPSMFYILQQEGFQKAAQDISPDMKLSFDEGTQKLTIRGLPAEVFQTKAWILEKTVGMSKKQLNVPPHLLDFLKTVDPMVMSQCLFTSQGISAIYSIESKGLFLLGSSESVLAAAESKMKTVLAVQTLDVEDQEVLKLHNWVYLKQQLLDTCNSANKRTVAIQIHPERRDKVMVAGFQDPVKEVTRSLKELIENYSRVQETIRVESCAVVQFIVEKKSEDWVSIAKANDVEIRFDSERPKIILAGARLHVQKAKICFQELTGALFTDTFIVDKPGAKKYFQTQGSLFLSTIMTEFSCVVLLRPEIQEEEEGEDYEEENGLSYCKVKTTSGVLVSVSKADICSFKVDAVVNAANEELKHIGGLPLALLKAAGPELQKITDNHVARNGKLRPGDAIVTGAYNLPCKHVVHAVGPRFSDFDRKTSVSRLNLAVKRSLTRAEEVNCSTIALPAISSGVFGFPVELCAETIAQAVREFCDSPGGPRSLTEIHLVDNNDKTVRVLATAVNKEFMDLGPSMTLPQPTEERGTGASGGHQSQLPRGRRFSERGGGGRGRGLQGNSGGHSLRGHARSGGHGGSGRLEQTTAEGLKIVLLKGNIQDQTCFSRAFRGQTVQRNIQHEAQGFNESPVRHSPRHSASLPQQSSASFSQVSSSSLGVYQMKMGQLTLEVSSGDITKEACDVIINSSNQDFTLKSGVSKAILDSAGLTVQLECSQIVSSPSYQPSQFIMTSGGLLPSRHIIHVVGRNDPAKIKEVIYSLLKYCEENKFKSVSFPALGTGHGGANPSAVADAMVDAVVDFVRKKNPRFVDSVKILIFQMVMMTEFHKSMKKREGEEVAEKSVFTKFKDSVTSFFMGLGEERPSADPLVLEGEEFEPTVFQLCADNKKAVTQAKRRIEELIVAEQAERTIKDQYISKLSQADMDQLKALQRKLTVSIRLDRGLEDQEPNIHLEGLTRDVYTAESEVRDIIRKVERSENLKSKALLLSGLVEWQFESRSGVMVPCDIYTNLTLEEALEKKEERVKIKINNETYHAKVTLRKAVSANGRKEVELLRKEVKDDAALPSHWDDMKGDLLKLFPLTAGSKEYNDVETELKKTGLSANIISTERVQNTTLWQSYQLMKKQLEVKNKHTNNERKLFHGTGANSIDLINKQGFNRSYAGAHGAMIGNGSYFAVNPVYSAQGYAKPDARGHKRMYLARVLVGDFTNGRSGLIIPPSKNSGNAADLYDSVADNSSNPTMFVVFNDIQAYPEYLITFT